jgi:methylated-DNA-[protein]-cysteine S-methyltransferase
MNTRHAVVQTSLGPITLVATGAALTGLYFRNHVRRPPQESFGPELPAGGDPLLGEVADQLQDYLAGRRRRFELPTAAVGDDFQQAVWAVVRGVQPGETTTYGRIAEQLGDRALAWQVGQALGANPLCIIVPCHRVVGADGSLTGYAGGLRRKRALLALEAA